MWHSVFIYIPCRTELGCCSSGMSIESALKHVDAQCVHYILLEVVPRVYYTLGEGLLLSLNSFWLWSRSPVELNVNNLEEYMSSYPFRILNTCNMSALFLLNWSVGRPKVVSLMLYGSFRRSLDSLVARIWTSSISFMSQSLNGDLTLETYSTCGRTRAL